MPKMSQMGIIPSSVPSFWEQLLFPQVLPSLASLFLSGLSSNVKSERSWLTIKLRHLLNPTCVPTAHPPSHLCLITLGFSCIVPFTVWPSPDGLFTCSHLSLSPEHMLTRAGVCCQMNQDVLGHRSYSERNICARNQWAVQITQ